MIRSLSLAEYAGQPYFTMPIVSDMGAGAPKICVTLMPAGDMWGEDETNAPRRRLLASLGIEEGRTRSLRQVHSTRVLAAEEVAPTAGDRELVEGDGLVSDRSPLVLFVRVADCYPIFLFDRRSGSFGVVHSGWRGTGIVVEALETMRRRYGSQAVDVAAVVGPGIRSCCYNVPDERAELFRKRFGQDAVVPRQGKQFLDLSYSNRVLLERAGVREVTSISDCTSCSPFLGSYRRQGPDDFTHMLALIGYFG